MATKGSDTDRFAWTFADLEAHLAGANRIAGSGRTAFQARLKNFHKLPFPFSFKGKKGKAALYGAGDIVLVALAVQLIELGLSPERIVAMLLSDSFAIEEAMRLAAEQLISIELWKSTGEIEEGFPLEPVYLFFDPNALASLQRPLGTSSAESLAVCSLFYGRKNAVLRNIEAGTGLNERLSIINVSGMLDIIMGGPVTPETEEWHLSLKLTFFGAVVYWSEKRREAQETDEARRNYLGLYLFRVCLLDKTSSADAVNDFVQSLVEDMSLSEAVVREAVTAFISE